MTFNCKLSLRLLLVQHVEGHLSTHLLQDVLLQYLHRWCLPAHILSRDMCSLEGKRLPRRVARSH